MLLVKLAWRNIFRNKRRTVLAGLAVGIGLASLIFVNGLMTGMLHSMIRTATNSFMGQGQIHAEGFRDTFEAELTIRDFRKVIDSLKGEEDIIGFTPRTIAQGMLTSTSDVLPVAAYGIDPEGESAVSLLKEAVIEGKFLRSGKKILIGSRAAELLDVGLGDRVVLTMAQVATGELSQEMFRVGGIFHYGIREVDSSLVFIEISKAREMLAIGDEAHEVALKFTSIDIAGDIKLPVWERYSRGGNEALGWPGLLPQLKAVHELSGFTTFLTSILVFGIVALTIMNTLFMSLYERMYEFGVMRAVGTRPVQMALIIVFEAVSLAIISIVIGMVIGWLLNTLFGVIGIDYSGIEFAGITMTEPIYTVMRPIQFTVFPVMILLFSLLAALYPAYYAAKLTPAKAMRKSL
ncbi:hypothetical protein LCGC14_1304190 [marine sediment metagenome]|uniref:ABC3 transporter permease protein domain-containing protein n=1 Tax=marine sediment metagenome TaxID=412755 RepID=A0A0F9L917_9ZZZZ